MNFKLILMTLIVLNFGFLELGYAKCNISLFVKNTSNSDIVVQLSNHSTGVKSKGGSWRALKKGKWFSPANHFILKKSNSKGDTYKASLGCNLKRRYRIKYMCLSGTHKDRYFTTYYPSAQRWTKNTDILIKLPSCNY